ncbi:UNVERIFIED_CONTAM: hypothetical protein Sindi_2398500 [Sesamum indicum]
MAFVSATIKFRISRISSAAEEDGHKNVSDYNFGIVLKDTMLNLGPTFIKVGQSLSTRPDIIGYEISKALSELHDQIPPFPRDEAMKIIEEELGAPVKTFFSNVSEEPVAAASFGQVYKASTHDGIDVAVKVQRPNLRHVVVRDIYILRIGLGLLQKIAKRQNDLRVYADELGKGLIGELDYNLEAANALEFKEVHSRFQFICLPKVFPHLSKKRVLTMEWLVGDSPSELISASSTESKRKLLDLVNKGVEASLVQLLETGLMHADPHPGNLRYISSGKIGFLDFGLLCRMDKQHQFAMLASVVHIVNGDWASLVHDLTEMDVIRPGTNIRRFALDLEYAMGEFEVDSGMVDVKFSRLEEDAQMEGIMELREPLTTSSLARECTCRLHSKFLSCNGGRWFRKLIEWHSSISTGTAGIAKFVLGKIWSVALKYHCRMPPYYILVLRSLASLEDALYDIILICNNGFLMKVQQAGTELPDYVICIRLAGTSEHRGVDEHFNWGPSNMVRDLDLSSIWKLMLEVTESGLASVQVSHIPISLPELKVIGKRDCSPDHQHGAFIGERLAVAADPTFKTFEAAYPYVVQKLLVDNSAAARRILHSVVFNRRREFQWQKIAVFLRLGATRKGLHALVPSNTRTSLTQTANGIAPEVNLANLALRLLPSKNGLVLRRLLMTADGASLIQALVSKEGSPFRHQLCKAVADILYQWMCKALTPVLNITKFSSPILISTGAENPQISSTNIEYESILRDRRLRVIFFKSLNSAKKDPILLLRFCWASFILVFVASAMASHRLLVSIAGAYLGRLSYNSKQIAVTA